MKENEYKCAGCGRVFEKGWSEEEARAEEREVFGENMANSALLCDECYAKWHRDFFGTDTQENAIHLRVMKVVKGKRHVYNLCGYKSAKFTSDATKTTCPDCKKRYVVQQGKRLKRSLLKVASFKNIESDKE